MVGIYRIFCFATGKNYIGQSKDIAQRINEHFYHRTATKASAIDKDINVYGIQNFAFQILDLCDSSELDAKEEYYINVYGSRQYGYNQIAGGQHNAGESNANVKLTEKDVFYIRDCYNQHSDPYEVYKMYFESRVSIYTFFEIWEGKSWNSVHMDVYTDDNKRYYKSLLNSTKSNHTTTKTFSDEEVMRFRNRYINETVEEIYKTENVNCKFNTFKGIVYGDTYKHLPVYNKTKKIWINKNL